MLNFLHIQDLGVIGDATLEPAQGLTVVTGETGAGKTLVVTGLGLLLGQRADAGLIRHGQDKALVEGGYVNFEAIMPSLTELGADVESDAQELIVTRQLSRQGRARSVLGGVPVPLTVLTDLIPELATIHGQSEQIRLASPERQREVLDRAAGAKMLEILADYRVDFSRRRAAISERDALVADAQARAREADILRYGLDEIAAIEPTSGEDVALASEAKRLQEADDLRELAASADQALSGSGGDLPDDGLGAVSLAGQARKALIALADRDPQAADLVSQSVTALENVTTLAGNVASYLSSLDADPIRLEAIAARRAELQALTRKYGETIDEVLAWSQASIKRLEELVHSDDRIETLSTEIEALDASLAEQAATMTQLRTAAAEHLSSAVADELSALAMPNAALDFRLEALGELGPWGAEAIHLLFTANAGSPPAPLAKVASGGELSRLRLALEVVLAGLGLVAGPLGEPARRSAGFAQTFVFDEVDAGVGGAVGLEIGRRLARLARGAQVIVVTHLAQVAAWADKHYVVTKTDDDKSTTASVHEVTDDLRIEEIARMMGGLADSQAGLGHARDLLAAAGRSPEPE